MQPSLHWVYFFFIFERLVISVHCACQIQLFVCRTTIILLKTNVSLRKLVSTTEKKMVKSMENLGVPFIRHRHVKGTIQGY